VGNGFCPLEDLGLGAPMMQNSSFWKGKRVLLTGHSGFKGGWLSLWLAEMQADVYGISLSPDSNPNLFDAANVGSVINSNVFCDICDRDALAQHVKAINPEIVFHLAAQPLVRASYRDPLLTFDTNFMGTAHLLNALRECREFKCAVMITTDKVYKNQEWLWPYRENEALGGHDPYSASKAASEHVISSFRDSFFAEKGVSISSARAGNVIGGGDWSEDRLLPDAVRAWSSGRTLEVRNPNAVRPWQHVVEPLYGYLTLAERSFDDASLAGAYNFGPSHEGTDDVRFVAELAASKFGGGKVVFGAAQNALHEAKTLRLDSSKSRIQLGVKPVWSLQESIKRTMKWYRKFLDGADARKLCLADIDDYEKRLPLL